MRPQPRSGPGRTAPSSGSGSSGRPRPVRPEVVQPPAEGVRTRPRPGREAEGPGRHPAYAPRPQPQRRRCRGPHPPGLRTEAQRPQQRLIEHRQREPGDERPQRARVPARHHPERRTGHPPVRRVVREHPLLVRVEQPLEPLVRVGHVRDAHHRPGPSPRLRRRPHLLRAQRAPAVPVDPPLRPHDRRRQDVPEVVVLDAVLAVDAVQMPRRRPPPLRVEAVGRHLVPDQHRVVVLLLPVALELLGAVEEHGDPGRSAEGSRRSPAPGPSGGSHAGGCTGPWCALLPVSRRQRACFGAR